VLEVLDVAIAIMVVDLTLVVSSAPAFAVVAAFDLATLELLVVRSAKDIDVSFPHGVAVAGNLFVSARGSLAFYRSLGGRRGRSSGEEADVFGLLESAGGACVSFRAVGR